MRTCRRRHAVRDPRRRRCSRAGLPMPALASPRATRRASSSASSRRIGRAPPAAARASASRSRATSSRGTGARFASNPTRAGERRSASPSPSRTRSPMWQRGCPVAEALHVATLNLRNIADRWPERIPLLLADMAALQPDLIGLQECVFAVQQDRLLGAAGEGRYESRRGWAGRPEYGNAILGKTPLTLGLGERLDLGRNRSALRVPVSLPSGATLGFVVTHLHHLVPDEALREEQAIQIVEWLRPDSG